MPIKIEFIAFAGVDAILKYTADDADKELAKKFITRLKKAYPTLTVNEEQAKITIPFIFIIRNRFALILEGFKIKFSRIKFEFLSLESTTGYAVIKYIVDDSNKVLFDEFLRRLQSGKHPKFKVEVNRDMHLLKVPGLYVLRNMRFDNLLEELGIEFQKDDNIASVIPERPKAGGKGIIAQKLKEEAKDSTKQKSTDQKKQQETSKEQKDPTPLKDLTISALEEKGVDKHKLFLAGVNNEITQKTFLKHLEKRLQEDERSLSHYVSVDFTNFVDQNSGLSIYHLAADFHCFVLLKLLIAKKPDGLHQGNWLSNTPILYVLNRGNIVAADCLLELDTSQSCKLVNIECDTVLHLAAGSKDLIKKILPKLKTAGTEPRQFVNTEGFTALHSNILYSPNLEALKELLSSADDIKDDEKSKQTAKNYIDVQNREGCTALHLAVQENLIDAVNLLIARGANVLIQNLYGDIALHMAVRQKQFAIACKLVDVYPQSIFTKNLKQETPLHLAFMAGDQFTNYFFSKLSATEILNLIQINVGKVFTSALLFAEKNQQLSAENYIALLRFFINLKQVLKCAYVITNTHVDLTKLDAAGKISFMEILSLFAKNIVFSTIPADHTCNIKSFNNVLDQAERANKLTQENYRTLLKFLIETNQSDLCAYLLKNTRIDLSAVDAEGCNPLHQLAAASDSFYKHLDEIVKSHAALFLNAKNKAGLTPFAIFCQKAHRLGFSPIQFAASGNWTNILHLCLHNADVLLDEKNTDSTESRGKDYKIFFKREKPNKIEIFNAAVTAAKQGNLEALKLLVQEEKMSIDTKDPNGKSLITHAIEKKQIEIVKFLVEAGADIKTLFAGTNIPLVVVQALDANSEDIFDFLVEKCKLNLPNIYKFLKEHRINLLEDEDHFIHDVIFDEKEENSLLHYLVLENEQDILNKVLDITFDDNITHPNFFGDTPFHLAARDKNFSALERLVTAARVRGMSVANIANMGGLTYLDILNEEFQDVIAEAKTISNQLHEYTDHAHQAAALSRFKTIRLCLQNLAKCGHPAAKEELDRILTSHHKFFGKKSNQQIYQALKRDCRADWENPINHFPDTETQQKYFFWSITLSRKEFRQLPLVDELLPQPKLSL